MKQTLPPVGAKLLDNRLLMFFLIATLSVAHCANLSTIAGAGTGLGGIATESRGDGKSRNSPVWIGTNQSLLSVARIEKEWLFKSFGPVVWQAIETLPGSDNTYLDCVRVVASNKAAHLTYFAFGLSRPMRPQIKEVMDYITNGGEFLAIELRLVGGYEAVIMDASLADVLPFTFELLDDQRSTGITSISVTNSERIPLRVCDWAASMLAKRLAYKSSRRLVLDRPVARNSRHPDNSLVQELKDWWKWRGSSLLKQGELMWRQPSRR